MDNELQKDYDSEFYVIVSKNTQGINKYISRDFGKKNKFDFTIKLHRAKKFRSYNMASRFIAKFSIKAKVFRCDLKESVREECINERNTY